MPTPIVIDISHHQPDPIDFGRIRASGIIGVIHKATEGTGYKDPNYRARMKAAKAAGLLWGAYHFGTNASVKTQWQKFLAQADPDGETLLALDYEDYGAKQMRIEQVRDFLGLAYEAMGERIVLYSGNTIKTALGNAVDPEFGRHRLWLPQYGKAPVMPKTWQSQRAFLWQYSDKGRVPGISGNVDVNAGDADFVRRNWVRLADEAPAPNPNPAPPVILPPKPTQPLPDDPGPIPAPEMGSPPVSPARGWIAGLIVAAVLAACATKFLGLW